MKILALDTTAKTATAAVLEDEKLLGIYTVNTENKIASFISFS